MSGGYRSSLPSNLASECKFGCVDNDSVKNYAVGGRRDAASSALWGVGTMTTEQMGRIAQRYDTTLARAMCRALGIKPCKSNTHTMEERT